MVIYRRLVLFAVFLFIFGVPSSSLFADDLPSVTITITKNNVLSGSPHTVSTFRPSVDLGTLAGMTQPFLDKYMDSITGISQGSSGGGSLGAVNQFASNVIGAATLSAPGASSQNRTGPNMMYGSGQQAVTLTPAQVASIEQQGAIVISTTSPSTAGAQTIRISTITPITTVGTSTSGSGNTTVPFVSNNPNMIVLPIGTQSGAGQYQASNQSNQSIAESVRQQNMNQGAVPASLPGFSYSLPLAIVLDTFWAPSPNAVTKAKLKVSWDITQLELNEFNRLRATGTLVPFASMGSVSMKTEKFEFRREVGARADINLSAQWKGALRKLVGIQFADIAVEINDPSEKNNNINDPLSVQTLRHSDDLLLSELAEKIISALSGKSESAGKAAGSASLGNQLLDKIIGQLGVKVQVVQSTLNRKATASFKATGKDFSGKVIPLVVASSPITFVSDNEEYPVNITFPNDCPPLKEIILKVTDVTYNFQEHGYPELVLTGFGQELPTGPLLERAELFTEANQTMTDWSATGADMKVAVSQKPVIYPFRGNITVGNPPGGLQGAQVRIFTKDTATGHESVFNTVDSNPAGDFVGDICLFVTGNVQPTPPPYIVEVSKAGYQTITSTGNPNRFVKTKESPLTYQISMPLSDKQMLAVSGRVLDNANQGVSGAEVLLTCSGVEYQTVSDASGAYQFSSVLSGNKIQFFANKSGLYFNPETRNIASGVKTINVDIKSSVGKRWGDAKFNFSAESGSLPPSVNIMRSSSGRSFSIDIPATGAVKLAVIGSNRETFTFSKDDFTILPGSVTAEFSDSDSPQSASNSAPAVAVKEFNIKVSSRIPSAVTLSADKTNIECFGSFYNPAGDKEKAVLTAKVVDAAGRPVGGANVRFEMAGVAVKILKEGTRPQGARPNAAYAQTDSSGNAQVTICSMREMGAVSITAAAYYGDTVSNLRSNGYALTIIENTRPERAGKPTCIMTAEAGNLGLSGPGVRISKGGDVLFHLNYSVNSELGTLTGYKFLYSKDNGPAQEEFFSTPPHPVARKIFDDAGSYNVQYMVKRTFDGSDTWSDPAQVTFTVVAYEPPRATLTLPRATGTVNLPLDYSFVGEVSAPFKQILITFGDNQGEVNLDSGLLNGKYYWSGTFYHTYTSVGTYQIKLKVTDQSNAFKEEIKQVVIGSVAELNDTTAPIGSISINNGAAFTIGKSVVIHAAATDDISGVYRMRYSNDGLNWSSWNSVAIDERPYLSITQDRVWQLTDGAGTKTVYVQFKDAADNISPSVTDTIELQAAGLQTNGALPAPQVTITGYQGAPMPHGSVAITSRSGNNISAVFSATNDWAIFVNQMALSFDNQNWDGWMSFEPNKQISLDGHLEAAKLYVIFADGAGGQSPVYSANIPAASAVSSAGAATGPAGGTTAAAVGNGSGTSASEGGSQQVQLGTPTHGQGSGAAGVFGQTAADTRQERANVLLRQKDNRSENLKSGSANQTNATSGVHKDVLSANRQLSKIMPAAELKPADASLPDLSVADIRLPREVKLNQPAEVTILFYNDSMQEIKECPVYFESSDGFKEKSSITFKPRSRQQFKVTWLPKQAGRLRLTAVIDYPNDSNAHNNKSSVSAEVISIDEYSAQKQREQDHKNTVIEPLKEGVGVIEEPHHKSKFKDIIQEEKEEAER